MVFKPDSRITGLLKQKRGFTELSEYLADNPDVDPYQFAPHRPIHIPVDRKSLVTRPVPTSSRGAPQLHGADSLASRL